MQTIDAAATFAAHNWQPIALRPNDKRPMLPGWQSTPLADTLAALNSTPGANLGLAIGPDMIALDIDCKGATNGFDTLKKYPPLPDTLTAATPSGGQHRIYRKPSGLKIPNRVAADDGLDFRAAGGYIVTAPSVINGRPYSWDGWDTISEPEIADCPPWLLELAQKRPTPTPTAAQGDHIPEGMRNAALTRTAGSLRNAGLNAEEIAAALQLVNERRCLPPLDDSEVAAVAASVGRYPAPLEPWQVFGGAELPPGAIQKQPRFHLLTAAELAARPPMRWLVRGVLPEAGLAAIYGPPGCGKSFLTLDLMGAIAEGRTWFSHNVSAAPCVYLALEGEAGVSQRMAAYMVNHGTPEGLRVILSPLDIRLADDRRELVAAIKGAGMAGGVLALDTLNRAAPGADENDSRAMGELIGAMKALQVELGGLVLAVHHSGKDQTKGLRGHSSLLAALDAVVEVSRDGDRREWRLAKAKDGEDGRAHPFSLKVLPVSNKPDEDGVIPSSCIVVPDGDAGPAVRQVRRPTGGNQRIIYAGLLDALKVSGQPEGSPPDVPDGQPCIQLEACVERVAGLLTCKKDQRGYRARTALTTLINGGHVVHRDGWLWLP